MELQFMGAEQHLTMVDIEVKPRVVDLYTTYRAESLATVIHPAPAPHQWDSSKKTPLWEWY